MLKKGNHFNGGNMKADLILNGITFKRNMAGFILSLFMVVIYAGIATVFIVLLTLWGPDALASFFVFASIFYIGVFAKVFIEHFKQPSSITITDDKKVIIGNNAKVFDTNDVHIEFYQDKPTANQILFLGFFHFLATGMIRLVFHCHGEKYELRYITEKNITRLFNALDDKMTATNPQTETTFDEKYWRNNIREWREKAEKMKKSQKIRTIIAMVFMAIILFLYIMGLI
jgi:hypothetical protein